MNKKIFLLAFAAAAVACFQLAEAQQQGKAARIGFLAPTRAPSSFFRVFREGLRELGYVEDKNVVFDYRSADTRSRLTELATELVQRKVDVIVTPGGAVSAAKTATTTIPIIFSYSGDPVEAGLVQSFARPRGNLTGITWMAFELVGKRLELLKDTDPRVKRVAVLANPDHPGEQRELNETRSTARQLGIDLLYQQVLATADLDAVLDTMIKQSPNALLVFPDSVTLEYSKRIAQFAVKQRLPSMYGWKEYVGVGGLMSYGPNREDTLRRIAVYVDKILKGRKPAELPVERPAKFELVINLKTAQQIGLTIPPNVLARADKVFR
ncbi:MAG: ABC transporter substrate-binding protein [Candidatus Binatia bacterium]